MPPWRRQYPDTTYDIKRVVSEGDLVLLRSNVVPAPGACGTAAFDIFPDTYVAPEFHQYPPNILTAWQARRPNWARTWSSSRS
ncbi:hypothetical protein ABZ235_15665 [Streptomyces canus]|uniref:hypothetical protein n=1 Tax=Streptomyces canus TaxID=58343 RepID=UPI0033AB1408